MTFLSDDDVRQRLAWPEVIEALERAFASKASYQAPERVAIRQQGNSYLTMPCVDAEGYFGVKQVAVIPGNASRGKPSVQAHYTLFAPDGEPLLSCSAEALTKLRTAGVSAVAAKHLAPAGVKTLLLVGNGALAPYMAEAHAQVRGYTRVLVWGRSAEKAERTAKALRERLPDSSVEVAEDLADALLEAEVITAATTAHEPIIHGPWLREGQHLDLVGAFTPEMREVDADAVKRAAVFVDDLTAAKAEAGDLIQAAARNWSWQAVRGELADVVAGRARREAKDEVTLFKSVGLALEDLAVARLLV
jgi:alanine dehydrogenase